MSLISTLFFEIKKLFFEIKKQVASQSNDLHGHVTATNRRSTSSDKSTVFTGRMAFHVLAACTIALLCQPAPALSLPVHGKFNDRPILGIMAPETSDPLLLPFGNAYIPASYVKYLESAGSRVVPIRPNLMMEDYKKIFSSINGILFPGGAVNLQTSDFAKAAGIFYKLALEAFDSGDYFPIWGTCLGLQLLTVLTAGENLLSSTQAENIALPLNLTEASSSSRMFRDFQPDLMKALVKENLTANFHHFGLKIKDFYGNKNLQDFYNVLSTNTDQVGLEFVSTMEGKTYPFYGVQWHPEVNRFQWQKDLAFPHSLNAVRLSFSIADFFVNEARKSSHRFSSPKEEEEALIYNYQPIYVGNITGYEQVYFF
ncbi:gamma-glutamyl hydrolase-like [Ambystoma mexicanum]|uniref:gamma-glutamyl hydrolase-like n=1 Tax=Ambystoma mexicanum TaxID=8296 RepID=UPI0037E743DE